MNNIILVLEETFGQVPVLLYKDNIIPESLIVCDLIDEVNYYFKLRLSIFGAFPSVSGF